MESTARKKVVRRLCTGAGVIILLCVAALVFLLPRFINKEMIGEKVVHLLAEKISATVDYQDADIYFFPLLRVVIRNASLTIPEKASGTIRTLTVYPELRPLFRGEVRLAKVQIDGPSLTLHIPAKIDEKTKSLEEIDALLRSLILGSSDIRLSVGEGNITLKKPGRSPVTLKEIGLSLDLAKTKDGVTLTINRLSSREPGLFLSGEFRVSPSGKTISLEAKGKRINVSPVRSAALALAGDEPVVQRIFEILRGGNIEQIAFQSKGSSLEDLGRTANININGSLKKGEIFVPGQRLEFRDVEGECHVANGILKGSDLTGGILHSRVKGGTLSIGLKGADALFHLDAAVSADLNDVHAILKNVVRNREFLEELGHIRSIKGKAEGRLVLGESLARVSPRVDVKAMSFTAGYDRVPYPLEIRKGRFSYDDRGAAVKGLEVAAGKSFLTGLDAQLRTGAETRLTILSGKAGIDTAEMHHWLSSYEKLKASLSKIASLSGRLKLSSMTFQGPVLDSQSWDFKISGSAENLLINTSQLPGPLNVKSGKFEMQTGQVAFSDAGAGFLDASVLISGAVNTSLESVRKGDIRLSGTVGPKALKWIKSTFSIPEYVRTDQAIAVSDGRLRWQEKGETTFEGNMKTGSGQSVALDLSKGLDSLTIRKLDVTDTASKASVSLDVRDKKIRVGFKGRLATSTVAGLITPPQIQGGMVQGEITAEFREGDVAGVSAQGRLRGEKIVLPWKKEMPLRIDSLDMSAERGSISIGSARLRLGENDVSLKGNIASKADGMVVDMDLSSDRIVWDDIAKPAGEKAKDEGPSEKEKKPLNVQGVVRLKSGVFEYRGLKLAPFHADIVMSAGETDIKIGKSGFCDIGMIGDVSISFDGAGGAGPEFGMDLRLEATDQDFKPTILCLSKGRGDATGLFTLKGHLKGRGKVEDFREVVEGKIEFAARKGTIYRYKTLDTVFDFLNEGEELKGQMPDLDKSELSYKLFKIRATVGNGSLVVEEAIFESAITGVVAQGSLNLVDNQLDLNVMVAPLRQVNKIVRYIPVIGAVVSGSLISVPVKVTGTTDDPKVTYLSPSAAASNLANMMKQTLNLPVKILSPLFPKEKQE